MKLLCLTIITLLSLSSCSNSSSVLSERGIESVSYVKSDIVSLQEIKKKQFSFIETPRVGYENGAYWFKVVVNDDSKNLKTAVFYVEEPSISQISIYNNSKLLKTKKAEVGKSNAMLEIENIGDKEYYINVHFKHQAHFPVQVLGKKDFYQNQEKQSLFKGLYYGIVLMVVVLNMIFYFSLKDITFLYYSFFLMSINISFTGLDGTAYLFFDQEYLEFFFIFFHFSIQMFGLLFASKFLQLNYYSAKLNLLGRLTLILPFVFYSMFLVNKNFLFYAIGDLLGLVILSFYWFLGIVLIKKEVYARFFVLGYSMVLFMGIFYLVPLDFGITFVSVSFLFLKLGALFEMMVLTYAITYRVKKIQKENEFFKNEIKNHVNELYQIKKELEDEQNIKANNNLNEKITELRENYRLTDREVDVVLKIIKGSSNKQIAEDLFISVSTVKYHTRNLYEKLDVKKRTEVSAKLFS